jgi:hypothetical protein
MVRKKKKAENGFRCGRGRIFMALAMAVVLFGAWSLYEDEEDIEGEEVNLMKQWFRLRGVSKKNTIAYVKRLHIEGHTELDKVVKLDRAQLISMDFKEADIDKMLGRTNRLQVSAPKGQKGPSNKPRGKIVTKQPTETPVKKPLSQNLRPPTAQATAPPTAQALSMVQREHQLAVLRLCAVVPEDILCQGASTPSPTPNPRRAASTLPTSTTAMHTIPRLVHHMSIVHHTAYR